MPLRNLPIKTGHLFLGLAAVMFIVTVMLFSGQKPQANTQKMAEKKIETLMVVVPLVPISEGKSLTLSDLTAVKWPKEFLPKGATFAEPYDLVGRVARQDLFPGEPIYKEKVTGTDTNGGLPAIIPDGMRAVSIAVTEVKGVAGFVKPGDRVDVLTTFEVDQAEGENGKSRVTRTVLQNVLVLASAQTMVEENKYDIETPEGVARGETTATTTDAKAADDKAKENADKEKEAKEREKEQKDSEKAARLVSSVTLALTPEQTEKLALAEETGDIRLSLRPETDRSLVKVNGVDFDQLLGKPARRHRSGDMPPAPAMPAAPPMAAPAPVLGAQVEFIEGGDKKIYNFN